jgi:hypothetical protein
MMVEFTDESFKPSNVRQPLGRSDEQAQVQRELADVDGHAGRDVQSVKARDGSMSMSRDLAGRPTEDALTVLTGRGVGTKPALDVRENYIGGSGVGSGSLRANTADGVEGPEDLDS